MNKDVILTGILVFLTIVLGAATKTDLQEANLHGKVHSIKTNLETTIYNQHGYLESLTEGNENYFNGDEAYVYDSNNRLLTKVCRNSNKEEIYRIAKSYDAEGLLIKEVRIDRYGEETDNLEYNAKKQLVWIKTYYVDGSLSEAREYAYDSAGNKISEKAYSEEMELGYKTIYIYNESNNLVEERGYHAWDTDVLGQIYKYDADGFMVEDIYYDRGELETQKELFYDKHHNVTNEEIVEMGTSISYSYVYTYDAQGNWLTREEYRNGKHAGTQTRVITYY